MDQVTNEKLQKAVTDFSTVCVSTGYKMRSKGLTLPDRDMDRLVQQAVEPLLYLFKELYDSREEYQKAADAMAAEHKVERDMQATLISKLQAEAEIEELGADLKEMEWYF